MSKTERDLPRVNCHRLGVAAAIALCLALPVAAADTPDAAEPLSFQERLMQHLRQQKDHAKQGEWVNRWVPGIHTPVSVQASADATLQTLAAGYNRALLDRGGWSNAWVSGNGYSAGSPLLAVAEGQGVTSRGAQPVAVAPLLAAR